MSFVFRCEQERLHGGFKYCHYITLTYSDKYLPFESFSVKRKGLPVDPVSTGESLLCPYDLTQFFKRYRLFSGDSIKYFCAGEYGSEDNTHRPHFHIILFCNHNWKTCKQFAELSWSYLIAESPSARAVRYKLSRRLKKPVKRDPRNMVNRELIGRVNVLSVTYRRTCYVAKYCNKCLYSDEVIPPFVRLSNGLGLGFLKSDTASLCGSQNRHFTYFQNGLPCAIPRYFTHYLFTAEQMSDYQLKVIVDNSPPDCCDPVYRVSGLYHYDDEEEFFRVSYDLDYGDFDYKAWCLSRSESLLCKSRSARLKRYGFNLN